MVQSPDWQEVETILFEKSKETIGHFTKDHPEVQCSFFAYFANSLSGEFAICLDTPENALQQVMKEEQRVRERREKRLHSPAGLAWWRAQNTIEVPRLADYTPIIDDFHFFPYAQIHFEGWTEFFDSESYPESSPGRDDYLAGNTRIVLWKVIERLVQEQIIFQLNMAPLFRLGYHFYQEDLIILRMLNWPTFPQEE